MNLSNPSRNRRAAYVLSSAAAITALCGIDHASGAVNSFFPGATFATGASLNDPTNWSLGHVPNDPTEEIVLPPGGFTNNAVSNTFDGANIVAGDFTHAGNPGRVLYNNSGTDANLTLAGVAGKPTIYNNTTGFQLSFGLGSFGGNNINIILGSTDNEFRSVSNSGNGTKFYANIGQTNNHTNVTLTSPNGVGSFLFGGSNSFNGALNVQAPIVAFDYSIKNGPMIASDGSLILNGGTIITTGNAAGTSQQVAMTTFNAGSTQFEFGANGAINQSTFDLGPLVRNQGAVANLQPAPTGSGVIPIFKTSTPNTNGIIGGWLTTQDGTSGAFVQNTFTYDWAANDGNGNVVHFTNYVNQNDVSQWAENDNINGTAPFTGTIASNVAINSLRLDNVNAVTNVALANNAVLTIKSGGIMVQNPPGSGQVTTSLTFSGSGAITSGTSELIFIAPGSGNGGGLKNVIVNVPIQDRDATHPVGVTTADGGALQILGAHPYSGDVHVNSGTLTVDTIAPTGQPSGLGTSGTIYLASEEDPGTLNFSAPAGSTTSTDRNFVFGQGITGTTIGAVIRSVGTLNLSGNISGYAFTKFGIGGWTSISGSQSYSGLVQVGAGTLDVNVIGDIGTPSGLGTGTTGASIVLGVANAACLNYSGTVDASTNRPISVNAKGQIIRVENNGTPVNLALTGQLSGTFDLQKLGSGTLTIVGSKSYSGALTIGKGDVSINDPFGIGSGVDSPTVTLGNTNTATLTFTGTSGTISRPFILKPQANQFGGIEVTQGTLNLTGTVDTNGKGLAIDGAGTVNLSNSLLGNGSLTKNGAGTLILTGPTAYTPVTAGLAFTDITKGRIVMDYTGNASPGSTVGSLLQTSFASGFSTGQIRSSTADAHKGLGWTDDGSHVTIAYTYFGDANVDGAVDTSDFTAMSQHFGNTNLATSGSPVWAEGDFNYDGKINALDFNAIATNFGSPPITAPALGTAVPEPAALSLLTLLSCARRRRH